MSPVSIESGMQIWWKWILAEDKHQAKNKKLYYAFVDLEKEFDKVPREVVKWALSCGNMTVNSGKWPCGVCGKGVQANSVQCTVCKKKRIHKRCSGD